MPSSQTTELNPNKTKQAKILEAALTVFLEGGYGNASMDEIALRAGTTKKTLYKYFQSKDNLFREIIQVGCEGFLESLPFSLNDDQLPIKDFLFTFTRRFLGIVLCPHSIALHRLVIGECNRFPELADSFYRIGRATAMQFLAEYFTEQTSLGKLKVINSREQAEQFIHMSTGEFRILALGGQEKLYSDINVDDYIRTSIEAFLRAYSA